MSSSLPRTIVAGVLGGAIATIVKTKAEETLQPLAEKALPPRPVERTGLGADPAGHPENMPPAELADRAVQAATGTSLSDERRTEASEYLHWAMGVGFGLVYTVAATRVARVRAGFGTAAGAALFGATHLTSLPAAGVQQPVGELPKAWWIWEGGSHLVYGVALDLSTRLAGRVLRA